MSCRRWFWLLLLWSACAGAALLEQEVSISEAEIQAAVDRAGPLEKRYGGVLNVSLQQPPTITLGQPEGRARVSAQIDLLSPLINQPLPLAVVATAGIRYDDANKAFYLDNPLAESVSSPQLGRDGEPMARQAVTSLLGQYFRHRPVYVLREDASLRERAARWLLKSVRIESGRVVATLAPF